MLTPQPDACPGAVGGLEGAGLWVVAAFFSFWNRAGASAMGYALIPEEESADRKLRACFTSWMSDAPSLRMLRCCAVQACDACRRWTELA